MLQLLLGRGHLSPFVNNPAAQDLSVSGCTGGLSEPILCHTVLGSSCSLLDHPTGRASPLFPEGTEVQMTHSYSKASQPG